LSLRLPECVSSPHEFLDKLAESLGPSDLIFASTSPDVLRGSIAGSPFALSEVVEISHVLAPAIGRLGIERAARGDVTTALELDAAYIRRSDAELLWKRS